MAHSCLWLVPSLTLTQAQEDKFQIGLGCVVKHLYQQNAQLWLALPSAAFFFLISQGPRALKGEREGCRTMLGATRRHRGSLSTWQGLKV